MQHLIKKPHELLNQPNKILITYMCLLTSIFPVLFLPITSCNDLIRHTYITFKWPENSVAKFLLINIQRIVGYCMVLQGDMQFPFEQRLPDT
jgi:hypothetical protein